MSVRSGEPVIVVSANSAWALSNYRLALLQSLLQAGFSIVALIPDPEAASRLTDAGIAVRPIPMSAHGTSFLREIRLLYRYVQLLREIRPAAFLGFTIKPNIYGALAGRLAGVPVVNNVTGLGMVFTRGGPLRTIVSALYRLAFRKSRRVFFQNRESRDLFLSLGFVREDQTALLPGSGVDLKRFAPATAAESGADTFTFVLASRLMWQKGIGEYSAAARRLRDEYPAARFQLLGPLEPTSNKQAIPLAEIEKWQREGVDYLGSTDDVRPFLQSADCVVLPSYYPEGVPRVLIEAAAMGKPIITTNTPGCRDVVEDAKTGYLCAPRSVESLVQAMQKVLARSPQDRAEMGRRARAKAESEFDEQHVIDSYLTVIRSITRQ